ncbi:hypothetical protein [Caenimonas soli]|uniref:hypothetical protein n=1 Tax=Caenimonas soli TaxID=2735555 RepID=UPI0015526F01|nr:hypothetical protein [Caenimonas soli]NPC59395.1 hypothetical protein [Caenimonas soli]
MAKTVVVYVVLACLGVGILLSFVPDFFNVGESSPYRLLILVAVVLFVIGPVVAVGYFILEAVVESVVRGAGWVLKTCLRAVVRFVRRLFGGTER